MWAWTRISGLFESIKSKYPYWELQWVQTPLTLLASTQKHLLPNTRNLF